MSISILAAGMGTNMAGMIAGMIEHGEVPPDLVLFVDTTNAHRAEAIRRGR